jgi:hypothetical protein
LAEAEILAPVANIRRHDSNPALVQDYIYPVLTFDHPKVLGHPWKSGTFVLDSNSSLLVPESFVDNARRND